MRARDLTTAPPPNARRSSGLRVGVRLEVVVEGDVTVTNPRSPSTVASL